MKPMPVAQAQDGSLIVVTGRAGGAELRSPLTDTPCVFWQVTVLVGGFAALIAVTILVNH